MNSISGDTIFNRADSVNLTKAINTENGMKFKIHALNGFTRKSVQTAKWKLISGMVWH